MIKTTQLWWYALWHMRDDCWVFVKIHPFFGLLWAGSPVEKKDEQSTTSSNS